MFKWKSERHVSVAEELVGVPDIALDALMTAV